MIIFSPQKSHLLKLSRCWLGTKIAFAGDYTYVQMIRHRKACRLTYHDWPLCKNEVYWIPTFFFFRNSKFWNRNSNFSTFQQRNLRKFFGPESLESKTESKFCFQWGSQKLEPKIWIPNQGACLRRLRTDPMGAIPCLRSAQPDSQLTRNIILLILVLNYIPMVKLPWNLTLTLTRVF